MPSRLWCLSDDIDHTADGVCAEGNGNNAFIDLDVAGEINRYIIEAEGTSDSFLRNAVNKHLDMLSAEAVKRDIHVRSHAAGLANFHTRRGGQCVAECFCRVLQRARVDCYCVVCRMPKTPDATCGDFHFVKGVLKREQTEIQHNDAVGRGFERMSELAIANGGGGEGLLSYEMRKSVDTG